MDKPLISIIIPTYNRASLIAETLKSIQNQVYENWECLIVDDGSTDNTALVLNTVMTSDKRFSILKNTRKKGAAGARNTGIEKAKGDFIYFFDSDDIMYPDLLNNFLAPFKLDNQLDFCCCEYERFAGSKVINRSNNSQLTHDIENHLENYGFTTQSFFLRKSVVIQMGFWTESLFRLQDVEYFSRLFYQKKRGFWIDKVLFKIRIHEKNITSTWNRKTSRSIIRTHTIIARRHQDQMNDSLKMILGMRITAFSISALASGYWRIALENFCFGLRLLPRQTQKDRVKIFLRLMINKPFKKDLKEILMYD